MKGISKLKHLEYKKDGTITVWQAWNIGKDMEKSKKDVFKTTRPLEETGVTVTQPFLVAKVTSGILKKKAHQQPTRPVQSKEVMSTVGEKPARFYSPEEGCIKVYRSIHYLEQHLDVGKHDLKLHEESQYDQIRRKWAQTCTSLKPANPSCPSMHSASSHSQDGVEMGWALPKSKQGKRFSSEVKTFLLE